MLALPLSLDWSTPLLSTGPAPVRSEFVGVALKTLGLPYNASAAEMQRRGVGLAELRGRVQELRKQVGWVGGGGRGGVGFCCADAHIAALSCVGLIRA